MTHPEHVHWSYRVGTYRSPFWRQSLPHLLDSVYAQEAAGTILVVSNQGHAFEVTRRSYIDGSWEKALGLGSRSAWTC